MIAEVTAFILKLNPDLLPLACANLPLGFAVWVSGLHSFNQITQFPGHHSKEENYPLLVDRFMAQPAEINGISIGGAAIELCVALSDFDCT